MHCLFWPRAWKLNLNILMSSSCCQGRGQRWRWAPGEGGEGGGLQSDRLTERSDNERSGLSGVQTASPSPIAVRWKGRESRQGERGQRGGGEVPSQLEEV